METNLIPAFDATKWQELELETARVLSILDEGEDLQPDQIKDVRSLKKEFDNHLKNYNSTLRKAMNDYKAEAENRLKAIGYDRIEAFVSQKQQEHKNEVNQRITNKQTIFNRLVNEAIKECPTLMQTAIQSYIMGGLLKLFPDMSSGAKNKENVDEDTITQVLTHLLSTVETSITELPNNQWITKLPASSNTMRLLLNVIESGDVDSLSDLPTAYLNDRSIIEDIQLRQVVTNRQSALHVIETVIDSDRDVDTKFAYIQKIMSLVP